MALDRYDDGADGPTDVKPEQHRRHGGSVGDAPAGRPEPAELRTRAECYEALRAADGRAVPGRDNHGVPDRTRPDRSGWDTVDPGKRPPLDAIRVTPERTAHILDGDSPGGGGHRHGTGKPGKTEFPASWNDEKIIDNILDVARKPDKPPVRQDWNDTWLCSGTRANVEVSVVIARSGEIVTGWPEEGGPGVVRNPRRGTS